MTVNHKLEKWELVVIEKHLHKSLLHNETILAEKPLLIGYEGKEDGSL